MATYGVQDLKKRYAVGEHTILQWIRNGDLAAINVSRQQGKRPKWRFTQESIDAFELLRGSQPEPTRTRHRRSKPGNIVEFY
jgi:hypothetical protein